MSTLIPIDAAVRLLRPGMRVLDAGNTRRQRESGRAERTITYVDDQRVRTPLGEFRARRVTVHFVADLRLADAITRTTLWVVPEIGVIAREQQEDLKVLGIPGGTSRERLVLVGSDPQISSNDRRRPVGASSAE